jgi:hypothetical protein
VYAENGQPIPGTYQFEELKFVLINGGVFSGSDNSSSPVAIADFKSSDLTNLS